MITMTPKSGSNPKLKLLAMDEKIQVKRFKVEHSIDEYTFPQEAHIHDVRFDEKYMHVELTDQRIISIPLWWIPTVYNASEENRNKFQINQIRTMIIWDPDKCGINNEISIADYLGPTRDAGQPTPDYSQKESQKQSKLRKKRPGSNDEINPASQRGFDLNCRA